MADVAKVRLVRCPKCDNLLPELADYSVYQCGGCGAVLRAKDKIKKLDTLSEKSDEERPGQVSASSANLSDKGTVSLSNASNVDAKANAGSLRCEQSDSEKVDDGYDQRCRNQPKINSDKLVAENGLDTSMNRDAFDKAGGREDKESNSQFGYTSRPQRSGRMSDWRIGEMEEFQRNMRRDDEGVRFSTSKYPDEGPSNYRSDSSYGFGEPSRNNNDPDEANRVQYLEKDRAELLRKLDELKDQLSRSCDVVDKPTENVPLNRRMVPPDPYVGSDTRFQDGYSGSSRASVQFYGPDKQVKEPPYLNPCPEQYPYTNRYEVGVHGFYPSLHDSNHIPAYGDPFGSQMMRRAPHHLPGHYQQSSSHPYFSGQYIDTNHDAFEPYTHDSVFHQPSCSCIHCYEKLRRVSVPVASSAFYNKRYPDVPNNSMMYHHENPGVFGSRSHNSRMIIPPPPLISRDPLSHNRWPSDLNSEMDGFVRSRPQRVVLAKGGRRCRPIAGGAPFLTCYNCFEFLQLPKKILLMAKSQQKIRCGACSTIINFAVVNKKLVLSTSVHAGRTQASTRVDDDSDGMLVASNSRSHGHINRSSVNFSSDDYDNSGYDFQSLDKEPVELLTHQGLNSSKPQEMQSFHSSSPSASEEENSPDIVVGSREVTNSILLPSKATLSPPPPGSPLLEHFDYSSNNHAANRFTKGNRSCRSEHEKVISNKVTTRQNSVKEESLATEMEVVSFNEYSNTGISQESRDASTEDDQARVHKGSESIFANIKKSFRDFSRSNQTVEQYNSNVSVNGRLLPDRLVKKAEKLAGPVRPGQYWYDVRAGFWGVMGSPCLGIIPPFIEEFNYPMPDNCSGGNTGVFVNGRELHQKDLDLLSNRGLPTARDRSYLVEISGKVLDEDSGEELDSLGKLAPTVEKVKHGFGMKMPKAVAQ